MFCGEKGWKERENVWCGMRNVGEWAEGTLMNTRSFKMERKLFLYEWKGKEKKDGKVNLKREKKY